MHYKSIIALIVIIATSSVQSLPHSTECNNSKQAPQTKATGTFVTDKCAADADCKSNCCSGGKCRNALALKSTESCGNGFSPRFNGPACAAGQSSKDANSGKVGSAARNVDQPQQPNITGTCAADQASKDANVGKVAAAGRNVDQAPKPNSNGTFITGACTGDAGCTSNCCVSGKCRAPLSLKPGVEACQSGFSPNFG